MSNNTPAKLSGKVALGIGAAIARRLAAEGTAIAITYSSAPQKAEEVVRAITSAGGLWVMRG